MFGAYYLNKMREAHRKFLGLTPQKRWFSLFSVCRFVLNGIGIRVLDDCERNWLTPLGAFIGIEQALLTIYTMYYYWDVNKITAIQAISLEAIAIPVSMKIKLNIVYNALHIFG